MTTRQILKRALARVRKGWCQLYLAKDRNGHGVTTESSKAVKWCALGAMGFNYFARTKNQVDARRSLACVVGKDIAYWNNNHRRTQHEVIEAFKKAIKSLPKKAKAKP